MTCFVVFTTLCENKVLRCHDFNWRSKNITLIKLERYRCYSDGFVCCISLILMSALKYNVFYIERTDSDWQLTDYLGSVLTSHSFCFWVSETCEWKRLWSGNTTCLPKVYHLYTMYYNRDFMLFNLSCIACNCYCYNL